MERKERLGEGGRRDYLEGKERTVHGDFEKKKHTKEREAKRLQPRLPRYVFSYFLCFILFDS